MAQSPPNPSDPVPSDQRLGALDDRRRNVRMSTMDRTYSSFVKKLRWILPVFAAIILGMLMVWPKIEMEISERRFAPSTLDKAALQQAATENRLLNADFSSTDSSGRPFTLLATEALQQNENPDAIILQNPNGSLKTSETETLNATSKHGLYAQAAQHLTLNEDVVLTRSDGTTMKTETLFVDLKTQDSKTDAPVVIDGPQGHLTAQGMDMKSGGAVTIFTGPAKLILNNTEPAPKTTGGS